MKLALHDIPQGHSEHELEVPSGELALAGWFEPVGPVRVALTTDRREDQITVRAEVEMRARTECGRCTEPLEFELESEFTVLAERRGTDKPEDEQALEEEGEVIYHDGQDVVLDESLREALILETPQVLLCRPDCKGLCPRCGVNRNETACDCAVDGSDPRWENLRGLKESGS